MKPSILIVEDEKIMRISLADALAAEGYTVYPVATCAEGLAAIREGAFSLVITDIRLPDRNGIEILRQVNVLQPGTLVIIMTAFGGIEDAVKAMQTGAYDYIAKPFALDEMLLTVKRALDHQATTEENIRLKQDLAEIRNFPNIVCESPAMRQVFALVEKISRTDSTVLIQGESGTGKELIASTIHYQSARAQKPFIKVNCAALPDALIESELFGYEKGAFTGAVARKPGRFELADGGTIFLDEIGDLPPLTQTKLLRVLEERSFERLGGVENIEVDVRVLAATHKDLIQEIKQGNFRDDLFYRLNVIPLDLPPLRRRQEDIPLLIHRFTKQINDQYGTAARFAPEAVTELCRYSWPGNVRELINLVERCLTLNSSGTISRADLPAHLLKAGTGKAPLQPLAEVAAEAEKTHIRQILKVTQGNRSRAAELLGISRKNLWEKMNLYNLGSDDRTATRPGR